MQIFIFQISSLQLHLHEFTIIFQMKQSRKRTSESILSETSEITLNSNKNTHERKPMKSIFGKIACPLKWSKNLLYNFPKFNSLSYFIAFASFLNKEMPISQFTTQSQETESFSVSYDYTYKMTHNLNLTFQITKFFHIKYDKIMYIYLIIHKSLILNFDICSGIFHVNCFI